MEDLPVRASSPAVPDREAPDRVTDVWSVQDEGPELRDYWRILRRRQWIVIAFLVGAVASAAFFSLLATPVYTAEAVLLIEPSDPAVIDIQQVIGTSLAGQADYYNTQHEILRSRNLAARVIRELRLDQEEAFFDGPWSLSAQLLNFVFQQYYSLSSWVLGDEEVWSDEDVESWLVGLYLDSFWVDPVRNSRLVRLYFNSSAPELATRVVNTHAQVFIEQGIQRRTQASMEASAFLEEKLATLRTRVEESEAVLNEYRRAHGIVSIDDKANVVIERLIALNEQLTEAEGERIAREAEAKLVETRDDESLSAVLESRTVQQLKEELARLMGVHAHLASRFKAGYPRRSQLEAQVSEVRARIDGEVHSIVEGIQSAYLAARDTEAELRSQVEAQKDAALRLKDASVEYAILEQDAETSRQLYDTVRQRIQETGIAEQLAASNVFVIDPARTPLDPSSPRKVRNLAFGTLLGLMGGVGLAFLAEYLDSRLRGAQEVERYLGLPTLGMLPDHSRLEAETSRLASARALSSGSSTSVPGTAAALAREELPALVTEGYRALRTNLLLSQAGEPPRTILFTSAAEGEGKTTTALHTAVMFARLDASVLVIDADLRQPRVHELLGLEDRAGLTEILAGQGAHLRRVRLADARLHFLGGGSTPPNPTELLGSPRMQEVLSRLRQRFDYVILDAPPLNPVSDAVVLSQFVDGVVLVVDQPATPRQAVRAARARLALARAKVLGVVLNRTDSDAVGYPELGLRYGT